MDIKANSLYQEMQSMAALATTNPAPVQRLEINSSASEFGDLLSQAIENVNGMQQESRTLQQRFDMGDPDLSLVDVMVAKEKSGIAFEATVQVRNKVLEAYKTIMNMPV
ncbi:flagellar hook-basal body complex protein FliE [Agaribacter marinus]|uniref:Flagellar hook-basal body complex protein FliE n=1 Tax=Agaribacter marinus TaxID=1431249 RepID=A0AA37T1I2_9ALTE|nr:flagellar hook-basal body complex protein FliE [Agaribacter marinus]GLR70733.1 flagellar hook-basal body complex protein FliE [Agaribacter marinus]